MEYLSSVCTPEEAADILKPMLEDCDREIYSIAARHKNHVVAANTVSIGTANASLVHPRKSSRRCSQCFRSFIGS